MMPDNTDPAAELAEALAEALAKAESLGDYGARYILPRWPTDLMMDSGLRQLRLHRCSKCEEEGDDHNDLFSAWHDMVDSALQGDAFTDPCVDVFDFLPALLSEQAAMKARIAELERLSDEHCIESATGQGQLDELVNAFAAVNRTIGLGLPDHHKIALISEIALQALGATDAK